MKNASILGIRRFLKISTLAALAGFAAVNAPAADATPADEAWVVFNKANNPLSPPQDWFTTKPSDEEVKAFYLKQAAHALEAADLARDFYQKFPDDPRESDAKMSEYNLLNTVMELGDNTVAGRVAKVESSLASDPSIPQQERIDLLINAAKRPLMKATEETIGKSLDESQAAVERILVQFPDSAEAAALLLQIANIQLNLGNDEKGLAVFKKIVDGDYPAELKTAARQATAKFDAVGKPLDIAFTSTEGKKINIADLKGKVVLVDFWATWCGPCMAGLPELLETYKTYHDKGFEVLGISLDSDEAALARVVKEKGITWPQFYDKENDNNRIAMQYGIDAIPTLWLVDKKGNLRYLNARADLPGKVAKLLAE